MSRLRKARATLVCASLFGAAFIAVAAALPQPRFIWNASPSAPLGLYYVDRIATPKRGDLVVINPEPGLARFLARRHYLPLGLPLLKKVAALPKERVCRFNVTVTINGEPVAIAMDRDSRGRTLPAWYGCRQVAGHELFLLNPKADSLDGRYFGMTAKSGLIGRAHPLLTREAPGLPLRWHGTRISSLFPHLKKETSQ